MDRPRRQGAIKLNLHLECEWCKHINYIVYHQSNEYIKWSHVYGAIKLKQKSIKNKLTQVRGVNFWNRIPSICSNWYVPPFISIISLSYKKESTGELRILWSKQNLHSCNHDHGTNLNPPTNCSLLHNICGRLSYSWQTIFIFIARVHFYKNLLESDEISLCTIISSQYYVFSLRLRA